MSNEEGCYLYGVIRSGHSSKLGPIGIGGRGDEVYAIPFNDIAAVVSHSPVIKYQVTRDNTMAHAKVLEKAADESTVLPVRFCTIAAKEDMIIERLLKPRYQELVGLLENMDGKIELGIRARWSNLDSIFAELVEENKSIKSLKAASLREKSEQRQYANRIKIGEMVQKSLEQKKKKEAGELLEALRPLALEHKEMQLYGDMNIINVAFLVAQEKEQDFDQKVECLSNEYGERKQLKYTSSRVAYNFVELVVNW